MTDNPGESARPEDEPAPPPRPEPDAATTDEDPGYLIEAGEAVADDGSVAPIIGGLPAVEGSSWDIGASAEDRGANLAETLDRPADTSGPEDA